MRSRRIWALTCAAGLWLFLATVLFVPALLLRRDVPGGLNYVTLLLLPAVVPAVAGSMLYARLTGIPEGRIASRCGLFAFSAALIASAVILAVQGVMDKDRASGAAFAGWLLVEILTIGLANAVIAALGGYWTERARGRAHRPSGAEK